MKSCPKYKVFMQTCIQVNISPRSSDIRHISHYITHYTIVCIFEQLNVDYKILHKTRLSDINTELQQDDTMSINKCASEINEKELICITKQASDWSEEVSSNAKTYNNPCIGLTTQLPDTFACLWFSDVG